MNFLSSNKILNHLDSLNEWSKTGDTSAPISVKIDLTNVCNHDCPGCIDYELIENDNNSLSFELLKSLLVDMKKIGVKGINYTGGGEPTIHSKFYEIIEYTYNLGFDIGLITNGSLFHKLPMELILRMFTWVRVSLDSYDSITHKRTHGKTAKFDLTINNLKYISKIKENQKLDTTIGVGFLTNQHSDIDRNVMKFVKICKESKVDYAQLRPSFGTFFNYDDISSKEWSSIFEEIKKEKTNSFNVLIDEEKYEKILTGKGNKRNYNKCHAQSFKATSITANGDVFICCSLSGNKNGFIGNIKKTSFAEIWASSKRKNTLENLNVSKCPSLCVGDNLNEFLHNIKNNKNTHINFL